MQRKKRKNEFDECLLFGVWDKFIITRYCEQKHVIFSLKGTAKIYTCPPCSIVVPSTTTPIVISLQSSITQVSTRKLTRNKKHHQKKEVTKDNKATKHKPKKNEAPSKSTIIIKVHKATNNSSAVFL